MTNEQLIKKMKEDMNMRNFFFFFYDNYLRKAKDIMKYFGEKQLEEVTTKELREFLLKYLKEERKLSDRSINYYNSVIRFIYEVTLDKLINKKQLPMRKKKKTVYKVLTKEELSTFFNGCDNFKYKTIFMLVYGSGLRIGEVANLREEDIDSKNIYEMPAKSRIMFAEDGTEKIISIERTLKKYANLSASELVGLTHHENTPWSKTPKGEENLYSIIELDVIKKYHKNEEL